MRPRLARSTENAIATCDPSQLRELGERLTIAVAQTAEDALGDRSHRGRGVLLDAPAASRQHGERRACVASVRLALDDAAALER